MVKIGLFKKRKQPSGPPMTRVMSVEHTDQGSVTNGVITGLSIETLEEIGKEFK